jgi:hypothetical protein
VSNKNSTPEESRLQKLKSFYKDKADKAYLSFKEFVKEKDTDKKDKPKKRRNKKADGGKRG